MAQQIQTVETKQDSSAIIVGVLKDENGAALPDSQIVTLTATLYDRATGTIINSRDEQNIKNTNGGMVDNSGNFLLHLSAADNTVIDGTIIGCEEHMLIIRWTYAGGTKTGSEVYLVLVENLERFRATIGSHTWLNYVDEVKERVRDVEGKLRYSSFSTALHAAVAQYGKDKLFSARKRITGTGDSAYVLATILGNDYVAGHTQILNVEYPADLVPAAILNSKDWEIYDDGSAQDGSNLKLRFLLETPQAGKDFIVQYRYQPRLYEKPQSGKYQNFPDTLEHFTNITLLAAAYCCEMLAAIYAPSTDSTISADVVNYNDKSKKYLELARQYLQRYGRLVGIQEDTKTVKAASVLADIDTMSSIGGDYLFHPRRQKSFN